jgi:transposase
MEQAGVFERLKNRDITQKEAAQQLGFSVRWVRKKMKRYRASGAEGLVHRNSGKASPRKTPQRCIDKALELLRTRLQDAGPTYLAEKLFELHGIKISEESMRQIMIRHSEWRVTRSRPKHRRRRERRAQVGIIIQLDGSPHDWFEGRAPQCTLLVFIDDATSRILWLEFVQSESVIAVMQATKNYLEKHGRPRSFYVDYGSVFHVNTNNPDNDKLTQFERAMQELDIEVKHAGSPQAKGRVERSNKTLQDRLIKDMRLANICSWKEANKFVQDVYIAQHNARFAIRPADELDAHRSADDFDLGHIMTIREERKIQNDNIITYHKRILQLASEQNTIIRPKNIVTVCQHLDGRLSIYIRQTRLNFTELSSRPEKIAVAKPARQEIYRKPSCNSVSWNSGVPVSYKLKHNPAPTAARTLASCAGNPPPGELGGTTPISPADQSGTNHFGEKRN